MNTYPNPISSTTTAVAVLLASLWGAQTPSAQTSSSRGLELQEPERIQGRRLALIVGNNAYDGRPLQNAVNDAIDMSEELTQLGFEVRLVVDATHREMEIQVDEFLDNLQRNDIALFFYSGHGMQIEGQNFLLPIDFNAERPSAVKYEAIHAQRVLDEMGDQGAGLRIVILDACRDNPYQSFRSGSGGLGSMGASGALIAFAAAPGNLADDNPAGRNGLFTSELLKYLSSGLELTTVFNRVRAAVSNATNARQVPWLNTGVIGEFYFTKPAAKAAAAASAAAAATEATAAPVSARSAGGSDQLSSRQELAFWESIKDTDDPALFEEYLSKWGDDGTFVSLAKRRLTELNAAPEPESVSARPDPVPVVAEPIERQSPDLQAWTETLPLAYPAKHKHTLGGCEGTVTLDASGLRFDSPAHNYQWAVDSIRIMERLSPTTLQLELNEKDEVLRFRTKKFRFELTEVIELQDFEMFQRLGQ